MTDEEKKDKVKGSLDALDIALRYSSPPATTRGSTRLCEAPGRYARSGTSSNTESPQTMA
jgi:hypothetical protein